LYYEEGHFKVLSAPSMTMGSDNVTLIVGHEGDALVHTTPVSIKADKAVLDILVLAMKPTEGTAALEDLMAQHKVTDFFPNDDENGPAYEFPLPNRGRCCPRYCLHRGSVRETGDWESEQLVSLEDLTQVSAGTVASSLARTPFS
jgi:hypothetical protein